ncbi:MAG: hypothetical protein S4CHLAM20_11040 [Chlamydiia bacterium]|nr:hypothetical protein [Chlamydiia bacterium]
MKNYSLKKSLSIFLHSCKVYKKSSSLNDEDREWFKSHLAKLKDSIALKDKKKSTEEAKYIENFLKTRFPLSNLAKFAQSFAMLGVALFFAICIRQTCFEFMEIPSGSMRPTFRECDRLVVSKCQFGINVPLTPSHFTFSPKEVKRMGTAVLTSEGMDVSNNRINYFNIFPGYKRFVKRMIGLPEDTLYFYGGKIYGIDKDGNDITPELQQDLLSHIEHIPYIYIGGRNDYNNPSNITIKQNNLSIASLKAKDTRTAQGKMIEENADDIYELWGMDNYAMTKIVPSESLYFSNETVNLLLKNPEAKYFLELTHHPSIKNAFMGYNLQGILQPKIGKSVSYIPLTDESLRTIWNNLYTSRFTSNKGYLQSFGRDYNTSYMLKDRPKIKGHVPDGAYEFFDGVAYNVKWQNHPFSMIPSLSIPEKVSTDHPYAKYSASKCVTLYNMGIEQSKLYVTHSQAGVAPARYAYFRDDNLYLMGKKIFINESSEIQNFIDEEKAKAASDPSYVPFIDNGAPLNIDGTINVEKIKKYGLHVPAKSYYVLGDNHAQSGDSREFGFVPEDNLRGVASFMLWAPGGRFGAPLQKSFAWFNVHKVVVWLFVLIGVAIYYIRQNRKKKLLKTQPIEKFIESNPSFIDSILVR